MNECCRTIVHIRVWGDVSTYTPGAEGAALLGRSFPYKSRDARSRPMAPCTSDGLRRRSFAMIDIAGRPLG
jgi:hypothetical protein